MNREDLPQIYFRHSKKATFKYGFFAGRGAPKVRVGLPVEVPAEALVRVLVGLAVKVPVKAPVGV
ncbi:MAG: hypothetical protein WB626_03405 [Bacteroidota bacterium]